MSNRSSWCHAAASAVLGLSFLVPSVQLPAQTFGPELIQSNAWVTNGLGNATAICPVTAGTQSMLCFAPRPDYDPATSRFTPGPAAVVYQNLPTEAGTAYHVSFATRGRPASFGVAPLNVYWGGSFLASIGAGLLETFAFDVLGGAGTSQLRFTSQLAGTCTSGVCDYWGYYTAVGDVSVRAVTSTPEPATFALVGGGLALVGVAGRRRRARR